MMSSLNYKNLSFRNWIIISSCLIAIVLFFLPWFAELRLGIPKFYDSGLKLALSATSTSGIPFSVFFATLIAPIICLISSMMYLKQAENVNKYITLVQIVLGVIGIVPFVLFIYMLKHAARRGNLQIYLSYSFWITILAMIGIVIGALLSYIEIKRLSASG